MNKRLIILLLLITSLLRAEPEQLTMQIVRSLPHDIRAFTQGLVVVGDVLYESTGQYGHSSLRKIDLQTGKILEQHNLPSPFFGEGIAYINGQIIQLTWHESVALIYDLNPIRQVNSIPYGGEGWGLCAESGSLLMTNGTANLIGRQSKTFARQGSKKVNLNGKSLPHLNDIVCVGDEVFANVWLKNEIYRIDKKTGTVTAIIDASHLLTFQEHKALSPESVLNGIAYRKETNTFFITGKYWPRLFEVRFILKPINDNSKGVPDAIF